MSKIELFDVEKTKVEFENWIKNLRPDEGQTFYEDFRDAQKPQASRDQKIVDELLNLLERTSTTLHLFARGLDSQYAKDTLAAIDEKLKSLGVK